MRPGRTSLIFCLGVLSAFTLRVGVQSKIQPSFLFLPFEDASGFTGGWEVGTEVPRFLSAYLKTRFGVLSISPLLPLDVLKSQNRSPAALSDVKFWSELSRRLQTRYVVTGVVEEFNLNRFMTGEPSIGGYESYSGSARVRYVIYDLSRSPDSAVPVSAAKDEASGEFSDRSLALTLFGKPSQRTVEFHDVAKIRFGSEDFNRTVIGQACFQLAENFAFQIEQYFPLLKSRSPVAPDSVQLSVDALDSNSIIFRSTVITGSVVFVEGKDVFINLGKEDGVRVGQRVVIYEEGEELRDPVTSKVLGYTDRRIGLIEIIEVRGPHLSLGIAREGMVKITKKARVRIHLFE